MQSINANAQDKNVTDSLKVLIKKTSNDSIKLELLWQLADEYYTSQLDTGSELYIQALKFAQKNYKAAIPRALIKAAAYTKDGVAIRAWYDSALIIARASHDTASMTLALHSMGFESRNQENFSAAIAYYFEANELAKHSRDSSLQILNNHDLGIVMLAQKKYGKAREYFETAFDLAHKTNDKRWVADLNQHFGEIYLQIDSPAKGVPYLLEAISLFKNLKKTEVGEVIWRDKDQLIECLVKVGEAYIYSGNYDAPLKYLDEALEISDTIKHRRWIAYNISVRGDLYYKKGDYKTALVNYIQGDKLYQPLNLLNEIKWNTFGLANTYAKLGNYRKAYEYHVIFKQQEDSVTQKDIANRLIEAQLKFDFDKKQQEEKNAEVRKDVIQQSELLKEKQQKKIYIAGGIILLIVAGGLVHRLQFTRRTRKQLEEKNIQIEKEKLRAEQSERFKQQFLANMSHEIRTPMNAVMGMTNLLIDKNPRHDQHHYLDGIKKSSETLLHIINEILDLSKIEAGKMELEKIDFSLQDVIMQVEQTLYHKAEEKGIELITEIDKHIPVLIGDPVRLNQVLMNLTGNAIKFTEKGSVQIVVKVSENNSPSVLRIQFCIIDTGIGIPQEKLETVFENFSQANTSDTRKYGGTGLGLSISRQLVELSGGNISVESEEGSGTTFSFELNFETGSAERLQQRLDSSDEVDGTILNGLRILIADDNGYNLIVATDTLKLKADVTIHTASNGKEAIAMLKENDFDVILMDVQMPEMNGFEATKYIRENFLSPKKDIPVIALTASVLRTDLDKCKQAGMNAYLPKPFKPSQLISGIAEVMGIQIKLRQNNGKKKHSDIKPPQNNIAVTDLTYLRTFCEGDVVRMKKYITMFLEGAPILVEKINSANATNDFNEIANQVHGFKTKWIMMGMSETKKLAINIEHGCRQNKVNTSVKENIETLVHQILQAVNELEQA